MHRKLAAPAQFSIDGGPEYQGYSFGACKSVSGEVAFTTSLVGYTESLTDPSYEGQILVFTQPLIGNYGVPDGSVKDEFNLSKYFESPNIHVAAVVVADYAWKYSHWTAVRSLAEWCIDEGVPAIGGIDTRSVVQVLREHGSCLGRVQVYGSLPLTKLIDPSNINLVARVSTKQPFYLAANNESNAYNVALIDCGVKENILRCLVSRGANVLVLPYDYDICSIANQFDGVFISNGPGDPNHCMDTTVANLRKLLGHPKFQKLPIFGICMGHQLLALAAGASIEKMKYGNRAHNIPTLDLTTGMCYITSQNHGYVVDATTLSERGFVPYFINLNDKTNEGLIHTSRPIFSTQFHPEAKGGPQDSSFLFDRYFENMKNYRYERDHVPQLKLMVSSLSKSRILQYAAST